MLAMEEKTRLGVITLNVDGSGRSLVYSQSEGFNLSDWALIRWSLNVLMKNSQKKEGSYSVCHRVRAN